MYLYKTTRCTYKVECTQVSQELILKVHASINIHGIIDHAGCVALATCWQSSVSRDGFPSVGLRIIAPDVVVVVAIVCATKAVLRK